MASIHGKIKSVSVEEFAAGHKLVVIMKEQPIPIRYTAWKNQHDDPRQACFDKQDELGIKKGVTGTLIFNESEGKPNARTGKPYMNRDLTDFKPDDVSVGDEVKSTVEEASVEDALELYRNECIDLMKKAIYDAREAWVPVMNPDIDVKKDLNEVDKKCIQKIAVTFYLGWKRKW